MNQTPPTPEDEFDALLHQQLADYGSPPSEAVWAAVQAQLAAPAAPPRRPRRGWLAGLSLSLLLLLTTIGVVRFSQQLGRQLPQPMGAGQSAEPTAAARTTPSAAAGRLASPRASSPAVSPAALAAATTRPGKGLATQNPSSPAQQEVQSTEEPTTLSNQPDGVIATTPGSHPRLPRVLVASGEAPAASPALGSSLRRRQQRKAALLLASVQTNRRTLPVASRRRRTTEQPAQLPATAATRTSLAANQPLAGLPAATIEQRASAELATEVAGANASAGNAASLAGQPLAPAELMLLSLRQPGLVLSAGAARPTPLPEGPAVDSLQPRTQRWSVQVLAGPTLTYVRRQERSAGKIPVTNSLADSIGIQAQERSSQGYAAQVQLGYALSGRLRLLAGLGFSQFVTDLTVQREETFTPPVSLGSTNQLVIRTQETRYRNTYQFLTLPLQLSWQQRPLGPRLSLGLLAGAEPTLYWAGSSVDASPCACESQSWSRRDNPYRSLSLSLSAGLDLRYRLGASGSRWHLVLQPTGRYMLSDLLSTDAKSPLGSPRLHNLGVLTGVAWSW